MVDERIIKEFEDAWRTGEPPDLHALTRSLAAESGALAPTRLLEELVMIDMEYRWRTATAVDEPQVGAWGGLPALEHYLHSYPELGAAETLPVTLIAEEYHVRQRWGDQPSTRDYQQRFPQQWRSLQPALEDVAKDFVEARVFVFYEYAPIHVTPLPPLLEFGRQAKGEPEPCREVCTELGRRLIIAPRTDRWLSRRHVLCEPCGKEHARVTCISRKNAVMLADEVLHCDQSRRVRIPFLMTVGRCAIRIAS